MKYLLTLHTEKGKEVADLADKIAQRAYMIENIDQMKDVTCVPVGDEDEGEKYRTLVKHLKTMFEGQFANVSEDAGMVKTIRMLTQAYHEYAQVQAITITSMIQGAQDRAIG